MSKSVTLLDYFPGLDQVTVADLASWLKEKCDSKLIENELGNRLLYPGILPVSEKDLCFDLAILHAALKHQTDHLYKQSNQNKFAIKIIIPETLLHRFPDLLNLVWVYIETFNPVGIISVYLQVQFGLKNLGTVIRPEILNRQGQATIEVSPIGTQTQPQKYQVKMGSILVIPASDTRVDITFNCPSAQIGNRQTLSAHVLGGELGIVIDLRKAAV